MSIAITEENLTIQHGTVSSYTNWYCRCPSCTDAMRQYQADRRKYLRQGHRMLKPGWRDEIRGEGDEK